MSLPKWFPEGSNILVKPDETEEVTEGGIIIPDIAKKNETIVCTTGRLVKIEPATDLCAYDKDGNPVTVKPAMLPVRIFYPRYAGVEIIHDDESRQRTVYRLMLEKDLGMFLEEVNSVD